MLDARPRPQRSAVEIALGRIDGNAPDRPRVGLGLLNLLPLLSTERPVLCVVDAAIAGQIVARTAFDAERIAERYREVVQGEGAWQAEFRFTGE